MADDVYDDIIESFDFEADMQTENYTQQLRDKAQAAGWPLYICTALSVSYVNGQYVVNVNPDVKEQVDDLQWGTPDSPASTVITEFIQDVQNELR
jgi:hypothetical protein